MKLGCGAFTILIILQYFHSVFGQSLQLSDTELKQKEDRSGNLVLTPLIESGQVEKARSLARVRNLDGDSGIRSFSGFFTVNSQYNSNMYFWFFPAQSNPKNAPLLIWLQGGPGSSALFGLFTEHGPFYVDKMMKLHVRQDYAWTLTHSIIYFDSPIGTGFSYTDEEEGYVRNSDDAAQDLYNALTQFYTLFPKYTDRDLYVTGESFAGKYIFLRNSGLNQVITAEAVGNQLILILIGRFGPALAYKIHTENKIESQPKINMKGMILGNAFFDPYNILHYGEVLYNFGLLDQIERLHFVEREKLIRQYIRQGRWTDATDELDQLFMGDFTPYPTYFTNVTGFTNYFNVLVSSSQPEMQYFENFVRQPSVRSALHVGNQVFLSSNTKVEYLFREDFMKSAKPLVEKLLDAKKGYRIFFYTGQLDLVVPYTAVEAMLGALRWEGSDKYKTAKKTIWRAGGKEILGYARKAKNLLSLLVRNAGHIAPFDQPALLFKMINTFTAGKPFE